MRMRLVALALLAGLFPAAAFADPNTTDTKLLSQPAASKTHVAFIYAEDLWVADLDGKNPRRLTSDLGVEAFPVFSPDGQTTALIPHYDGTIDVYAIPHATRAPKRLTSHPG